MAKGDTPPFRMIVEQGPRLAPTNGSDAERLSTYRIGSEVNVVFTRIGSRVMERKWWAILGLVVNRCNVPWTTKEQASEAVKLALGIVNLTKTVSGAWMQYPKSLTELSDPELDAAVLSMMDLITKMTGIDPEALRKEAADAGRDEQESPDAPSPASGEGSGASIPVEGSAPDLSAAADLQAPEEPSTPEEPSGADAAKLRALMIECLEKFIGLATDQRVPDPKERRSVLAGAKDAWKEALPEHLDFVKACFTTADKIIKGELPAKKAEEYLRGLL